MAESVSNEILSDESVDPKIFKFSKNYEDDSMKNEISATLSSVLPDDYLYFITDFTFVKKSLVNAETQFDVTFRVNVDVLEDIDTFFVDIGKKSGTTYNKFKGDRKGKGTKVIVSGNRKCHHFVKRHGLKEGPPRPPHTGPGRNPGADKIPGKNTCCPAKIKFALSGDRLHTSNRYRLSLTNQRKSAYPLEVILSYRHNHSINSADAMRYRPVSEECKEAFITLFKEDHTPSSALAHYKKNICSTVGKNDIMGTLADRSIVPDYFWAFHFYSKYVEDHFGSVNGPEALNRAKDRIDSYNEKHGMILAKMEQLEDGGMVVAICDKFCRRVHEYVHQSGDIVLMDATSNLDRHDTKLFHLICPTPAGGLPLGNILTSKEDEDVISAGIKLYTSILPDRAFFGRGPSIGPKILMTDDSAAERNALAKNWADSVLLLCIFHPLQAYWRYLWNSDLKIEKKF